MDVTPLRAARVTTQCDQHVVVDLTVGENGKLKPRNLCFLEGGEPHTAAIIDLTTPPKNVKSKHAKQESSGQNSCCKVVNLTVDRNVSQSQVGTVMLTPELRSKPRLKEVSRTEAMVDLTIEQNATPPQVVKAKPVKQDSSGQNSRCEVVNQTGDNNVSQPLVGTVMSTPDRRFSPQLKEVPYTAAIIDLTTEKNATPPQNVKSKTVNQNPSGQSSHCQVVNQTVDNNVSQPQVGMVMLTPERRFSPRLKEVPQDKRPYYGSDNKRLSNSPKDKVGGERDKDKSLKRQLDADECDLFKKRPTKDQSSRSSLPDMATDSKSNISIGSVLHTTGSTIFIEFKDNAYLKWTNYDQFIAASINEKASSKVKDTKRTFNKHYLHFVQEEEKRCKKIEEGCSPANVKKPSKQPDLKALREMLQKKETLNVEKNIVHIPAIPVGHKFFSRAEMAAVGFRGHWSNDIDYIGNLSGNLKKHKGYSAPLAVAIVLSGQYEDVGGLTEVIYTGQGGNDLPGNKRQAKDQVMLRGNSALKNNMELSQPVRVIRGHECSESHSRKVYMYCGLYKVVKHWAEKGVSGDVLAYRLMPLLGQPKLDLDQVKFEQGKGPNGTSNLLGLVCEDMSAGEEELPVPVTNVIDSAKIVPPDFKYIKSVQYSSTIPIPRMEQGCKCNGKCSNRNTCSCARLNGDDFPYVQKDGGRLVEPKDVVYECGPLCGCGPSCINRSSQRPLKYRLEVFRTKKKGWAVRSWDLIPSGAPVIEYTGIVRRNNDLDNVSDNEFIFEIDCWHTMHGLGGRERRQGNDSSSSSLQNIDDRTDESESDFCVDGGKCGNVSRFINHSCDPNLFVQCVLSSHRDLRLARIVLFAADDIPPMQELTYDYGYALDSVVGPDGKLKHMTCYCGTGECRGRLY